MHAQMARRQAPFSLCAALLARQGIARCPASDACSSSINNALVRATHWHFASSRAFCTSRRTQAAVIMAISSMGRGWHHLCVNFRGLKTWANVCHARPVGDMLGFVAGYAVPGQGNGRALPEGHRETLRCFRIARLQPGRCTLRRGGAQRSAAVRRFSTAELSGAQAMEAKRKRTWPTKFRQPESESRSFPARFPAQC